jgi:hypothetical protein
MLREVGYAFGEVDYQVNTASPATRIRIGYDAQGEGNSTIDYFRFFCIFLENSILRKANIPNNCSPGKANTPVGRVGSADCSCFPHWRPYDCDAELPCCPVGCPVVTAEKKLLHLCLRLTAVEVTPGGRAGLAPSSSPRERNILCVVPRP